MIGVKHFRWFDANECWDLIESFIIQTKLAVHFTNSYLEAIFKSEISPRIPHLDKFIIVCEVEQVADVARKISFTINVEVTHGCPFGRIRFSLRRAIIGNGRITECFLKIRIDISVQIKIAVDKIEFQQFFERHIEKIITYRSGIGLRPGGSEK
jgi:hypothetical protein